MPDGFASTTFLLQAVANYARSIIYSNNFFFGDGVSLLTDFPNQKGTQLKFPIEYSWDDNGGTFNYDDAMPVSDDSSGVFAYFTKVQRQKSIQVYNTLKAYNVGNGDSIDNTTLGTALSNDPIFMRTVEKMKAQFTAAFITQLESDIDSAGSYSDASLLRSTYGFASYEDTTGGVITLGMLDDAIEALMGTSYGQAMLSDLIWLMPINQFRRLSDLGSGTFGTTIAGSMLPLAASSQDPSPVDAGRIARLKTYNEIPIVVVPGMTTTNILLVRKGTLRRCEWRPMEVADKTAGVLADQELYHLKMGANVFCDMPRYNAKISGLTA